MISRRSFLRSTLIGAATLRTISSVFAQRRRPLLWIADSETCVASAVQVLARHCGLDHARLFISKGNAANCLQAEATKPALLLTDFLNGDMRCDKSIQLARNTSPGTKLILFSAVIGNLDE